MGYEMLTLREDFTVDKIVSVHYFEYSSNFYFDGESHDFWEFLCVDKGEVTVAAGNRTLNLAKNEIIFHKPNEFHNVRANGVSAPNLVVIGFSCLSPGMDFFKEKVLTIDEAERNLLATIVTEAQNAFCSSLDDPYSQRISRLPDPLTGAEQMIRISLESLFIHLYRRYTRSLSPIAVTKSMKSKQDDEVFIRITDYLENHIGSQLTIEQICRDNLIGRSQLQKLFQEKTGIGVIEKFSRMKIDMAKQLIRERSMNFTQIADFLGYTSVHYFSRQFRKLAGMTASEYASSIKLRAEKPKNWPL